MGSRQLKNLYVVNDMFVYSAFKFFQNIRDNLVRSISLLDADTINASSRSEWPAVLHNICMLHNVIRLRSQFQLVGWNKPEHVSPGPEKLQVNYSPVHYFY